MTRPSFALLGCLAVAACGPGEPIKSPPPPTTSAPSPTVTADPTPSASPSATPSADPTAVTTAEPPRDPPPIPPNTVVLNIGDSFLQAYFAQSLKPKLDALGAHYEVKAEQATYTVTWAAKMDYLLQTWKPDLVIINLGANELANIEPEKHAPAVRKIAASVGDIPCVWVSPPSWRKDTGILEVIRTNTAPCRFFNSDTQVPQPIPRQGDKIHPNKEGGQMWADAFWKWLLSQRAPAEPPSEKKVSPWKLKAAPPEEHQPKPPSKD